MLFRSLSHATGLRLGEALVGILPFESNFSFLTGEAFLVLSWSLVLAEILIGMYDILVKTETADSTKGCSVGYSNC